MFEQISPAMQARMAELEQLDAAQRAAGLPTMQRLRQIPPKTGQFLALMLATAPVGAALEVGTSGGYSALWLSLACRARRDSLTTFELLPEKFAIAQQTFAMAGCADVIHPVLGDVLDHLGNYSNVAFCFLDTEKTLYHPCFELVAPNFVPGGLLLVDNVISHAEELAEFLQIVQADARFDSVIVPIGKGILLARRR